MRLLGFLSVDELDCLLGGRTSHLERVLFHGGEVDGVGIGAVVEADDRVVAWRAVSVAFELEHQRNRHHVHLAADGVGELVQREQRRQRRIGERASARHGDHLPVEFARLLDVFAGADESAAAGVDRGVHGLGRRRAGVHDVLVAEVEQMLGGRVHAVFVIDTDGGVESVDGRRVDADDRHTDALELFDLFLVDGEGRHEHRVYVASHWQVGEELAAHVGGVDVLEDGDVIAGVVHDRVDAGEDLGVEPTGDLLVHEQRHTERLPGFQGRGRAGDVEVELVRGLQHLVPCLLRHDFGVGECAGYGGYGNPCRFCHFAYSCFIHVDNSFAVC